MEPVKVERTSTCHVVAVPYPGRGHINPMMNLCKLLSSKKPDILITFVVTEEWHGYIASGIKPANIRLGTIPNVIPSEIGRAKDFPGFVKAVSTKLEAPFEHLLDKLELPVNVIVADTFLVWMANVGTRRNIPVASLWPMSAAVFSVLHHFDFLVQNRHFPVDLSERGEERVDYIPGMHPTKLADLPTILYGSQQVLLPNALEIVSNVSKEQYLLSTSVYELEAEATNALKSKFPVPVYPIGPLIPYFQLKDSPPIATGDQISVPDYINWLDSQLEDSVLYVSMGSFLSVSSAQMDEIAAGVYDSGVRFLWVSRGEIDLFEDYCGDRGLVVPWCDQLRVLCHPSVAGFWTHCGWSSTLEAAFAGVPMLTYPIFWDQVPNSKKIVEDWKIGWAVRKGVGSENLVTRKEIASLVQSFMDPESWEVKEMRKRARELHEVCQAAVAKGGSSDTSLNSFIADISQRPG